MVLIEQNYVKHFVKKERKKKTNLHYEILLFLKEGVLFDILSNSLKQLQPFHINTPFI